MYEVEVVYERIIFTKRVRKKIEGLGVKVRESLTVRVRMQEFM